MACTSIRNPARMGTMRVLAPSPPLTPLALEAKTAKEERHAGPFDPETDLVTYPLGWGEDGVAYIVPGLGS